MAGCTLRMAQWQQPRTSAPRLQQRALRLPVLLLRVALVVLLPSKFGTAARLSV
jgi:hypothetical protein